MVIHVWILPTRFGVGKNSFHIVGLDKRGAIILRQKWSRGQVEARFANMPPCLIGMEAGVGAQHLSRKLNRLGHDALQPKAGYIDAGPPTRTKENLLRHTAGPYIGVNRYRRGWRHQASYVASCSKADVISELPSVSHNGRPQ
jgi:transposase